MRPGPSTADREDGNTTSRLTNNARGVEPVRERWSVFVTDVEQIADRTGAGIALALNRLDVATRADASGTPFRSIRLPDDPFIAAL